LKYSIVNYKNVRAMTLDFRLDADYFRPKYLKEDRQRRHVGNIIIGEFCYVTDGQHGYHEVDENSPIFHLTAKNAKGWFVHTEGADMLAKWVNDQNKRSSLKKRDLILSTRGTVGLCALVTEEVLPANIDQDVARVAILKKEMIKPEYLLTYLNSKFGQDWLIRNASGMVQQGLPLDKVRNIPVPLLSCDFQKYTKQIIERAHGLLQTSKTFYKQAEQILLCEINLQNWKPKYQLSFVKNFSDTLTNARIDAEYFQPMYGEIEKTISKYDRGFDQIGRQFKQNKKSLTRILDKDYQYIEISCVNISDGSMTPMILRGDKLPANAKIKISLDDIIVSKVRPYRGAIGIVTSSNYVGSGAFTVLQETGTINKETLFVFLRSKPMLEYSLKFNTGTSYPTITDDDILSFPLPLIDETKQKQIKAKVEQGINAKYNSLQLLDIAKRGVEIAIEKDEKQAQNWMNSELKKLIQDNQSLGT